MFLTVPIVYRADGLNVADCPNILSMARSGGGYGAVIEFDHFAYYHPGDQYRRKRLVANQRLHCRDQ